MFNGNTSVFYFGALGVGFAYAGILVIFPGLTSQNFGMRNQGLNYGFMYFGFAVGAVIAPYATSAIAKQTGSYNTVFLLTIVLLAIGIVLTLATQKYVNRVLVKLSHAH